MDRESKAQLTGVKLLFGGDVRSEAARRGNFACNIYYNIYIYISCKYYNVEKKQRKKNM